MIVVAPMLPVQRGVFGELWALWLRDKTGRAPEAEDLAIMDDAAGYYRQTGGDAFLAALDGQIVGAVALRGLGASGYELCNLVVTEAAGRHGVERALVDVCLERGAIDGGKTLWFQSSSGLEGVPGLYRRMGFCDASPPPEMKVRGGAGAILCKSTIAQGWRTAPSGPK